MDILNIMEMKIVAAEGRRARIAESEGKRESRINYSQGVMSEAINISEGEKQKLINEAEGKAKEIEAISKATALGIAKVSAALEQDGGDDAIALRIADAYINELKKLAKSSTELILPLDLANLKSVMETVTRILKQEE